LLGVWWPRLVFPQGIAIDDHRPSLGMVYVPNWSKSQFQHVWNSHVDWCNRWLRSFSQVHWSSSSDEEVQFDSEISQKVVQFMLCPGDGYLWRTRTKQGWPGSYVSFLWAVTGCYRLLAVSHLFASSTMPLICGATACGDVSGTCLTPMGLPLRCPTCPTCLTCPCIFMHFLILFFW
jgi:hypothetical protein